MIKYILVIVVFLGAFSSCKKESNPYTDKISYSGNVMINFNNYYDANNNFGFVSYSFPFKDTLQDFSIGLKITNSVNALESDVKVYLSYSNEVVYDYNGKYFKNYVPIATPFNAGFVNLDLTKPFTILKGQRDLAIPIKINVTKIGSGGKCFGLVIDSVVGADINLGDQSKLLVNIQALNDYDADYTVTGYFFHPSSPRAISDTKTLTTVTSSTSQADLGDLGGSGYQFNFDTDPATHKLGNWSAQNGTPTEPASGFMTKDNPAGIATYPGSTTGLVATTYNNTYDPSAKIFWMHYGYQVGSTTENKYQRQVYEKWVRK